MLTRTKKGFFNNNDILLLNNKIAAIIPIWNADEPVVMI